MAYLIRTIVTMLAAAAAAGATAQTTAPAAQPAASGDADVNAGYVLGEGDVIEVDVLGQPEFKTRSRVRADGTIALPFLGDVRVAGQTPITLANDVGARLRAGGYYAKPIVNVEVAGFASNYVVVLGHVGSPGLMPVDREYRVSEVIARAGGISEAGSDYVVVRRASGEELRLPFEQLARGTAAQDPIVNPGDKVFVPRAEQFYMYGQINAPGVYPIKGELTLRKALAQGGGVTPQGSQKRVKVFREGVEQKAKLEDVVRPGDVIVIGERLF